MALSTVVVVRPTRDGCTYVSSSPICSKFSAGSYSHQRPTDRLERQQVEWLQDASPPHGLQSPTLNTCLFTYIADL